MHKYQRNTIKSYLKISAKNKTTTHIYNNKIKTYKILIRLRHITYNNINKGYAHIYSDYHHGLWISVCF
jgi:hypothetical protein